jgi:phage/plasmid-associated DNA primase
MTANFSNINKMTATEYQVLSRCDMKLREQIDQTALQIIIDNFTYLYDEGIISYEDSRIYPTEIRSTFYKMLKQYHLNKKLKGDIINYKFASKLQEGRMYSKGISLQTLPRVIRQSICKDLYYDIDMVNSAPCILLKYCLDNGVKCDKLQDYINDRTYILSDLSNEFNITLLEAKKIPISIINGSKANKYKYDWVDDFKNEIQNIYSHFFETKEGKNLLRRVKNKNRNKKFQNSEGEAMTAYIQKYENIILTYIFKTLQDWKYEVGAFCFDGLLLYKDGVVDEKKLITDLNAELEEFGWGIMKLKIKEMDECIDFKQHNLKLKPAEKPLSSLLDDRTLAEYFVKQQSADIKYNKQTDTLFVYKHKVCRWDDVSFDYLRLNIKDILTPYVEQFFLKNADYTKEQIKLVNCIFSGLGRTIFHNQLLPLIKQLIKSEYDDEFIRAHFNKKKGVFPLKNNKVIDLHTLTIRPMEKTDYFTLKGSCEYITDLSDEDVKFARTYIGEILDTANDAYIDYMFYAIGYSLTGENCLKRFFCVLGAKDGGKSLFLKLLQKMFGFFGGTANDRVFNLSKASSVHDQEMFSLQNLRMACVSELSEHEIFNEKRMKGVTGNDIMNLRRCGSDKNELSKFDCILWIATNELPSFKDDAFKERMRLFDFKRQFQKNAQKAAEIESKVDIFFTLACQYAKRFYDNQMTFADVIEIKNFTNSIQNDADSFEQFFIDKEYKITGDIQDKIKKLDLYMLYKSYATQHFNHCIGRNIFYRRCKTKTGITMKQKTIHGIKCIDGKFQHRSVGQDQAIIDHTTGEISYI